MNFYTLTLRIYNLLSVFSYSWAFIVLIKVVLITQCVLATQYHCKRKLDNSPICKLEKGKPITLAEKNNSAVHLPVNWIPTFAEFLDQHQQLGGRMKHFSSFGTNPLRQSCEKQAQRGSKYYDRFISEEKIFTDTIK